MDAEFERRWMDGEAPFDGLTVSTQDYLPLSVLRRALRAILVKLHPDERNADLFSIHDWHFHDELITEGKPIAWAELMAMTTSDEAVISASPADDQVFLGVYPSSRAWYLRFHVPQVDDLPGVEYLTRHGRFDFTSDSGLAHLIAREFRELGITVKPVPATAFFHRGF